MGTHNNNAYFKAIKHYLKNKVLWDIMEVVRPISKIEWYLLWHQEDKRSNDT
jgi:hypothetical protein